MTDSTRTSGPQRSEPNAGQVGETASGIAKVPFGRTGHLSTRVIFGAAGLGRASQETTDRYLELIASYGVNHIDTAADYGESELRLAPWLATHRHEVFLATKTGQRDADGARRSLERSLERLGVDSVDLIQLHNLVEDDEWELALSPGGALEGLLAAKREGLTRFVGVTGHGLRIPGMHLRSLQRYDFDSVLLPYNFALLSNADYRRDAEALLEVCAERNVAVQTIKSLARRRWPADHDGVRHSWYQPLPPGEELTRAVRFVLGNPQVFLNSSSDMGLLEMTLQAASNPWPVPSQAEMQADLESLNVAPLFDGVALERI
jgi:aryl-alcohol dehydrogenase-like predicted oxidoreductase